jgi:DNA-binding MarR family transcriptional regulator
MLEFDWEQSVGYWVCSTAHLIRRELSKQLAQEGITLRQWEVLAWLSARGCASQVELAEYLGIEPPTLTGVLSRMEDDGLIYRKSCDIDGRRKTNHPTERAQRIWERASEICHRVRARAVANMSEAEVATFKRLCEQVQHNLGGLPALEEV